MKLKSLTFLLVALGLQNIDVSGQSKSSSELPFEPHGKPVILVFSNLHSSFNREGNNPGFEITRAYLGYEYDFSESFSAKVIMDVGDPGTGGFQMTAFIKNAFLMYKNNGLSARIGMIGVDQFNVQEKHWGYRYIYKSFQDEYRFGSSADLGAGIEYSPAKFISFDASLLNGEGYKKIQSDSTLKSTFGLTVKPVEGVVLRGYYDIMKKDPTQSTIALFAGYTYEAIRLGLEYNIQRNNKMLDNHDFSGISVWASLRFAEKFSVFARYDKLESVTTGDELSPWNYEKDGERFLAGLDYSPVNGVKIAPVWSGWSPSDKTQSFTSTIGLHFEIKY
jgi:hypothetical protein